jgi:hypothetical protein
MNWELTGNHYVCLPRISRSTGAIHSVNVVHRGLNSLIEWGTERAPTPDGPAFLFPEIRMDDAVVPLEDLAWERLDRWLPRFRATLQDRVTLTCTIAAPGGFEPLVRGALVRFELDNQSAREHAVVIALVGDWRWSLRCVATVRPLRGSNRLFVATDGRALALEAAEGSASAALAITASGDVRIESHAGEHSAPGAPGEEIEAGQGQAIHFRVSRSVTVRAGRRANVMFALGVAPERDGALTTARHIARFPADDLIQSARLELARITRHGRPSGLTELLNRNLVFAYYCAIARAIDDDRIYPLTSRSSDHGPCTIIDEAETLNGTLPLLSRIDPHLARELLVRSFDLLSDRAGYAARYLDGGVAGPGFALDRLVAYVIAADRYVIDTNDQQFAQEHMLQDVLREMDDYLWSRLHPEIFLCSTELLPSGERADYPFVAYDNALVWRFCQALSRLWRPREEEPPARFAAGADELMAAFWQHCTVDHDGVRVIAGATDLAGNAAIFDDPAGSLMLLPWLGFCSADDPIWADTIELLRSERYPLWLGSKPFPGLAGRSAPGQASLAALCADLLGPQRDSALQLLRRLQLDAGVAARTYDPDTGQSSSGAFAPTIAALLAHALLEERKTADNAPAQRKARKR